MKHSLSTYQAPVAQVQGWADKSHALQDLIAHRFPRAEPRQRALVYVKGLLSPVERKNGWQLAEQAGDRTPYGVQHLLGRAQGSAEAVRDDVQTYVLQHLADSRAVLILDETGFLKKGDNSAGVARQYSGTAGRIENCQIGVFLAYAGRQGRTFLDRELYLPKAWIEDAPRCRLAGIPAGVKFATKLQLGRRMLERAFAAGIPAQWVTGDTVYGTDWRLRSWLDERRQAYVLAVSAQYRLFVGGRRQWAKQVVAALPAARWRVESGGAGSKGERLYEWAHLEIRRNEDGWWRWLLARRSLSKLQEIAYYVVGAPSATGFAEMARVAGTRWAIEGEFRDRQRRGGAGSV